MSPEPAHRGRTSDEGGIEEGVVAPELLATGSERERRPERHLGRQVGGRLPVDLAVSRGDVPHLGVYAAGRNQADAAGRRRRDVSGIDLETALPAEHPEIGGPVW